MEYILFGLGVLIITISLIITYKQNSSNNQEDYLQSELLSELRAVKNELEKQLNELEKNDFQQVLEQKVDQPTSQSDVVVAVNEVQNKIIELEEKIDRLESKINYSLSNPVNDIANTKSALSKAEEDQENQEHQAYQEIKELVEEGLSLSEVAQKLDMGTREVRLIWKFNSRGEE